MQRYEFASVHMLYAIKTRSEKEDCVGIQSIFNQFKILEENLQNYNKL